MKKIGKPRDRHHERSEVIQIETALRLDGVALLVSLQELT
jgi:hypothetical protein